MRASIIGLFLLLCGGQIYGQDLELGVHVLPTSMLGDPAVFNIKVQNMGEETVQGVEVRVNMESGLEYSSFTPNILDFNPETGVWNVGELYKYQSKVLSIMTQYVTKDNAILMAEVIASSGIDPDSTPGNGIDTNGNGKIVHDKGDEDDGDAAQNGPFN